MSIGRNDRCWCGSGLKFKKCHLGRESERPLAPDELEAKLRSEWSVRQCMHPLASRDICNKVAAAHSIARSSVLNEIVDARNHVNTFYPIRVGPTGKPKLRRTGWRDASVFTGFCGHHDSRTFAPLETKAFTASLEQCFLLGYRSVCHEFYQKRSANKIHPTIRRHADRGMSAEESRALQHRQAVIEAGTNAGLRDITAMKNRMDNSLVAGDFANWESCIVRFGGPLSVVTTGLVAPNFDAAGGAIQVLHDISDVMESISISVVAEDGGGCIVLGWERSSSRMARFVQSIEVLPHSVLPTFLVQYIFAFIENTYFSNDWWESLSEELQGIVVTHAANANAYYQPPTYSPKPLVPWRVSEVFRVHAP